ncbi:hypothetical protein FALCPG4_014402 [Fusarium falciforme]
MLFAIGLHAMDCFIAQSFSTVGVTALRRARKLYMHPVTAVQRQWKLSFGPVIPETPLFRIHASHRLYWPGRAMKMKRTQPVFCRVKGSTYLSDELGRLLR